MPNPTHSAIVYAGLILEDSDGDILFMRRANTGFADGQWSLPGGRVDPGELLVQAAAREGEEELGVKARDLRTAYVLNKVTDQGVPVIGWYFHTTQWDGTPVNAEPDRCSGLRWINPRAMDPHTEITDRTAIEAWTGGQTASWM
ncbi:NUDIX domain-containing protein [Streptomyces violascens]|uniref:NUDIX domain-containing protein n=1 Tax=Streptomyces violascens TaxID=67381 RepID=UPI0036586CBC